jgi:hypothetical protein
METHSLNFKTDYGQFYILDAKTSSIASGRKFPANDELIVDRRRLGVYQGLLTVPVVDYIVNAELRILEEEPPIIQDSDHIVEASLTLFSGNFQIKNHSFKREVVFDFVLPIDAYRVRVTSKNLNVYNKEKLVSSYIIEIWAARFVGPKVHKTWIRKMIIED